VRYGADGFRLRAGRLGELRALELVTAPRRRPGEDEVELRVQAAGLNFRDVLKVMGLLGTGSVTGARLHRGAWPPALSPDIIVSDARRAMDWYVEIFGAQDRPIFSANVYVGITARSDWITARK
jgi:hypothetical protein